MTDPADDDRSRGDERPYVVRKPSRADLDRAGRRLVDVLLLAEQLPIRHSPTLEFPASSRFKGTRG